MVQLHIKPLTATSSKHVTEVARTGVTMADLASHTGIYTPSVHMTCPVTLTAVYMFTSTCTLLLHPIHMDNLVSFTTTGMALLSLSQEAMLVACTVKAGSIMVDTDPDPHISAVAAPIMAGIPTVVAAVTDTISKSCMCTSTQPPRTPMAHPLIMVVILTMTGKALLSFTSMAGMGQSIPTGT